MFTPIRYLCAAAVTVFLVMTGSLAIGQLQTADDHGLMMSHDTGTCVNYCISKVKINNFLSPSSPKLPMTALTIIFAVVILAFTWLVRGIFEIAARSRPSPNLVKLYACYLN